MSLVHIARDYSPATTGYTNNVGFRYLGTTYIYNLAMFMQFVLGYSFVSSWGFNISSPARTLTITNVTSASPPIVTTSTPHGLANGDAVTISGVVPNNAINGNWMVLVVNATQFIAQTVSYTGPYSSGGTIQTGFQYASGTGAGINVVGAPSLYSVQIPTTHFVSAGEVGKILVLKSTLYPTKNSGIYKISSLSQGNTTTIASGSNTQTLPQATIFAASTTAFPTSGTIYVVTSAGTQIVTYTSTTQGATPSFNGCSGGTGTMSTGGLISNFNGYLIDYRSSDTPPTESGTMNWFVQEVETAISNYIITYGLNQPFALTNVTNTSPIVITFGGNSLMTTGQTVAVSGVVGNTAANGTWTIHQVDNENYQLIGSAGNGNYSSGGSASVQGYQGDGYAYCNRLILQSPHPIGWQVRMCVEPITSSVAIALPVISVTTGFGGNATADFPVGGIHNHIPLFLNIASLANQGYVGTVPGGGDVRGATTNTPRQTMVGDDGGQAVFVYDRASINGMTVIGIPDNEPIPNAPNSDRTFVYGSVALNSGQDAPSFGGIQLYSGVNNNCGIAYRSSFPELVSISSWSTLDGATNSIFYSANATDSVFTSSTEVLPLEVWGGTITDPNLNIPTANNGPNAFSYNQRFMGTAPFLRGGRTNFTAFTLTSDSTATSNISGATQTSPIQITTSSVNALTTGQTVVISGVLGNTNANGTFVITVIDNTHFTLNGTTGNASYTGGGIVTGTAHWIHLQNGIYLLWNGCAGLNA